MANILNINTALETAFIILSKNEEILMEAQSSFQKDHASFLEPAIKKLCSSAQVRLNDIDAVSVVNGPGSYTGLRVGLSSAKALCYALEKPLILLNTLDVMAFALKLQLAYEADDILFCPLIDARRLEVYTALYDFELNIMRSYSSEILDTHFLEEERKTKKIIVGGNGSLKLQKMIDNNHIVYVNPLLLSKPSVILSNKAFIVQNFANVAYCEPFYLKPVYFRKE